MKSDDRIERESAISVGLLVLIVLSIISLFAALVVRLTDGTPDGIRPPETWKSYPVDKRPEKDDNLEFPGGDRARTRN